MHTVKTKGSAGVTKVIVQSFVQICATSWPDYFIALLVILLTH